MSIATGELDANKSGDISTTQLNAMRANGSNHVAASPTA